MVVVVEGLWRERCLPELRLQKEGRRSGKQVIRVKPPFSTRAPMRLGYYGPKRGTWLSVWLKERNEFMGPR